MMPGNSDTDTSSKDDEHGDKKRDSRPSITSIEHVATQKPVASSSNITLPPQGSNVTTSPGKRPSKAQKTTSDAKTAPLPASPASKSPSKLAGQSKAPPKSDANAQKKKKTKPSGRGAPPGVAAAASPASNKFSRSSKSTKTTEPRGSTGKSGRNTRKHHSSPKRQNKSATRPSNIDTSTTFSRQSSEEDFHGDLTSDTKGLRPSSHVQTGDKDGPSYSV